MRVIYVNKKTDMDLTYGKSYEVIGITPNDDNLPIWGDKSYAVIDDKGFESNFTEPYVIPETKYRRRKLLKINSVYNGSK